MNKVDPKPTRNRDGEKGAAMVMALMISFLLLVASAGLLLESSLNSQNVTDATSEQQAYNAAESGIQSAVNVLRGNVAPSPLLDSTKAASDPANRISFVRALRLTSSNVTGDTSTQPRLSRWMGYSSTCNDRIVIGNNGCSIANGYGFAVTVSDPDNTGTVVSYNTSGRFFESDLGLPSQKTWGTGANTIRIQYVPATVNDLNVAAGAAATNFGTFVVSVSGTGSSITAFNRFEITINMTKPYLVTRVIRGYIETNTSPANPPKIIFDAQTFTMQGSVMTLGFGWGLPTNVAVMGPPQRYGYEAQLAAGNNVVTGTVTSPEPIRLLVRSTGYGPRGAEKRLEAIVQKDSFNGLTAPATLTLVGPPSTTSPATTFMFNPGSSNVTVYSGDDVVSTDIIPPIGTTNPTNLDVVEDSVSGQPPHPFNGTVIGSPSDVSLEMPEWMRNPSNLDATIQQLANVARSSGRFFPNGVQPTSFGNNTTGQGITFCDGNCTFTGAGGGIMVVTGKLTLHGNFNFNGLIIVTGQAGVDRSGGGNGTIQGNIVISPYVGSRVEDTITPGMSDTFLSPQYNLSGGGNSTVVYNSQTVNNGLVAVSNYVLGVVEK